MQQLVRRGWARLQRGRADAFTSAVLTVPVFLLYHLGILFIDHRNGVDWVSGAALSLLDASVTAYVAATLGLSAALSLALLVLRRYGKLRASALVPTVLEGALWAVGMLIAVGYATSRLVASVQGGGLPLAAGDALARMSALDKLVLSAGAGFHEELFFRVGLFGGGAYLLQRALRLRRAWALLLAAVAAALLFALVHHVGPYGEPLALAPLVFRTLAGLYLTLVYAARGFAVAVYAHTLYDLLVFFS